MADLSLLQDFVTETTEHLEEMEKCLLALDSGTAEPETFNGIFRSVHTIKGSAEYIGLGRIAELSHRLENLLEFMRQGKKAADPDIVDLLIAAHDRIGLLVRELSQEEEATVKIDDLLAQIETACPDSDAAAVLPSEARKDCEATESGENAGGGSEGVGKPYEEHYDRELFAIFLAQLRSNLEEIRDEGRRLAGAQAPVEILERCIRKVDALQTAANYMGYDRALVVYSGWTEALTHAREKCENGIAVDWKRFCEAGIEGPCRILEKLFPLAEADGNEAKTAESAGGIGIDVIESIMDNIFAEEDAPVPAGDDAGDPASPAGGIDGQAADLSSAGPDLSLIGDFISETHEQLEELEQHLVRMTTEADDPGLIHAVFRSIHTIKGAAEYVGLKKIAELSHRLESILDVLRQEPQKTTPRLVDTLIAARDRMAALVQDLGESGAENRTVDDILEQLDAALAENADTARPPGMNAPAEVAEIPEQAPGQVYGEEYDSELFSIFLDQFEADLNRFRSEAAGFRDAEPDQRTVDGCLDTLASLTASANYMGYDRAVAIYRHMVEAFKDFSEQLDQGETVDWDGFMEDTVEGGIGKVRALFPAAAPAETAGADEPADGEIDAGDGAEESAEAGEGLFARLESAFDRMTRGFGRRGDVAKPRDFSAQLFADPGPGAAVDKSGRAGQPGAPVDVDADDGSFDGLFTPDWKETARSQPPLEQSLDRPEPVAEDFEATIFSPSAVDPGPAQTPRQTDSAATPPPVGEASKPESAQALETAAGQKPPEKRPLPMVEEKADRRTPETAVHSSTDKFAEKMLKQSIRVDAKKIDDLINQVGELVVNRAYFSQLFHDMKTLQQELSQHAGLDQREMKQVKAFTFKLSEATVALGRAANDLQEGVMRIRMLPISQLFNRYPRLVHDLVKGSAKKVRLDIHGEDTELDKMIIEEISDPMIHIIRNAVDHGVETVERRRAAGKPETGTIKLEAYHESNHVVVEISDDGGGIDIERLKQTALEKDLYSKEELDRMSHREITSLVMRPGFSTAARVTHTSGRGVGMDVVKKNIEKLNGTLELESDPGIGTHIRLKIPLTLAIIPALLVEVGDDLFTIPLSTVDETLRIDTGELTTIEGVEVLEFRNGTLPVVRLTEVFNMTEQDPSRKRHFVVVVSSGMKQMGIIVDRLIGQEEVVIKPLEDYLQENSGFSGATILGDGRISLILDIYELINLTIEKQARRQDAGAMA
jgi:two-component system chemotaxis sensor kinase CheA